MAHRRVQRRLAFVLAAAGLALVLGTPAATATAAAPVEPVEPVWGNVGLPSLQAFSGLRTIAAADTRNAWAIGFEGRGEGTLGTQFALHWDGSSWRRVEGFPEPNTVVDRVVAASPQDIWAYGVRGQQEAFVAWHWTGSAWRSFELPFPGDPFNGVIDRQPLAVVPGAAWIINSDVQRTWVWRWDGTAWTLQPLGSALDILAQAVTARAPNDAWVVGSGQNNVPAVRHWDGTAWRVVPTTGLTGSLLRALAGPHGTLWAIGASDNALYSAYWNGHRWRTQSLPVTGFSEVEGLVSDGQGGLWAAPVSDRAFQSLYLRYQNGHWTKVYGPVRTDVVEVRTHDLAAVPGTATVWSAGSQEVFRTSPAAIIERVG
jgi:hypothetical protein